VGRVRIDLHTHSSVSDGTEPPGDVVRAAAAAGLDVVALTDHDTTAGWAEAEAAADEAGIRLVRGIEISTKHRGAGVHLLAYEPDAGDEALQAELDRVVAGREDRAPAMIAALNDAGIELTLEEVGSHGVLGRPHVADALVRKGVVRDRDQAFAEWLDEGRPGYVDRYAADLVPTIALVRAAGGVAVIAHPWSRGSRRVLPPEELARLADVGLAGVEVDHGDHLRDGVDVRPELRAAVRAAGLVVTGSSDHHGTGKTGHDLGSHTTAPEEFARLDALLD
jgi:3',5'-nucleoside bisphosphate phosphatase